MKQIFLIGLLLLVILKIAAQTENVDSLVNVLNSENHPKDKNQEALLYAKIGSAYAYQSKHALAIEYYLKALSIAESANDLAQCSSILANIAGIHALLGNGDQALSYAERAMTFAKKIKMPKAKLHPLYQLATIYSGQGKIGKALECEKELINLSRTVGNKVFELAGFDAMTTTYYLDIIDYDKALEYSDSCMLLAKAIGNPVYLANTLRVRSSIFRHRKNFKECEATALEGLAIDSTDLDNVPDLFFNIAFSNACMGNTNEAEDYVRRYNKLTEKKWDQGYKDAVASQEVKYETQKKEMRIASLEKERRLYSWLGVAGGLIVISMGITLWQTIRNVRKERQLIAAQSIQDGELNERARLAEDLHDRLGGSLSAVKIELQNAENLQKVGDKLDQCIKEIREITHNLMPRSLRLSGLKGALEDFTAQFPNVHFHFFGEEKRVKERLEFAVYCCANELITNSLRHSNAENVNVQLVQSEKHVSLTVQDDGCGFDEATVKRGIGLKNIQDRVASFNGKLDTASAPGKGTETVIELKVDN